MNSSGNFDTTYFAKMEIRRKKEQTEFRFCDMKIYVTYTVYLLLKISWWDYNGSFPKG